MALLTIGAGCEVKRPKGAYQPLPLAEPTIVYDGGAVDNQEDAAIVDVPDLDGSTSSEGGPVQADPLAALQGDYLVRFDNETWVTDRELGRIDNTTRTDGVMRVVLQDGKLVGTEWLCRSNTTQRAEKGSIQTSFDNDIWNALTAVTREIEVDLEAGTWQTGESIRRQGWRAGSSDTMPTNPNTRREDFLDPEQDGVPGLRTTIAVDASLLVVPVQATCRFDLVSYSITHFEAGTLDGAGKLASAQVKVDEQDAHAWQVSGSSYCELDQINDAQDPRIERDDLRLSRLDDWLQASEDDPKPCPSQATFDQAF